MTESILDSLARHPAEALAIVTPSETVDFAELRTRVAACSRMLAEQGVSVGRRVAVAFADPIGHIIVSLALMQLGARQLVLPLSSPADFLTRSAARAGTELVIADQAKPPFKAPVIATNWRRLPAAAVAPDHALDKASFLVLGSGTTGEPKLINLTAEQFELQIDREQDARPIAPGERFASIPSVDFLIAKRAMFACLKAGGTLVVQQTDRWSLKLLDRLAVDHLLTVVVHAQRLLAASPAGGRAGECLPGLKSLTVRSSPVSEKLREGLRRRVSRNSWIAYGTNEFGTATLARADNQIKHPETVGRACTGVELEIVDDNHHAVPHGQTGRIRMRAPGMFSGYVDAPEETAMALRDGWFYPNDLGALMPDGTLIFKGRTDDMMIFDGTNIAPREIELTLELHAAVDEAIAFPVTSEKHGDVPCAAVRLNRPVAKRELLNHCRALIGGRAPLDVFTVDEFPRNPAGKVNKRVLRAQIAARA